MTGSGNSPVVTAGRLWSLAGTAGRLPPSTGRSISPNPVAVLVDGRSVAIAGRSACSRRPPAVCLGFGLGRSAAGNGRSTSNVKSRFARAAGFGGPGLAFAEGSSMSKSARDGGWSFGGLARGGGGRGAAGRGEIVG